MTTSFFVAGDPIAQPRPKATVNSRTGRARVYNPLGNSRTFRNLVTIAAKMAHKRPRYRGPLQVDLVFVLPRPAAKVWKRKQMVRLWHVAKPDSDNLQKLVFDAMNGILWKDDSQICSQSVLKVISNGDEETGVYVTVKEIESEPPRMNHAD